MSRKSDLLTWRPLATGVTVFAVLLALSAAGLALYQSRVMHQRLRALATLLARQVSAQIATRFENQVNRYLGETSARCCEHPVDLTPDAFVPPAWMDGLWLVEGKRIRPLNDAKATSAIPAGLVEGFVGQMLRGETTRLGRCHVTAMSDGAAQSLLLGIMEECPGPLGEKIVIVGRASRGLLVQRFIEPLIPPESGLVLESDLRGAGPWRHPLPAPLGWLGFWLHAPSLEHQRQAVQLHTMAYLALTLLSLGTLLLAMFFLTRAVRRELGLAELKSNFVADVSHEIKTPLAMIQLFAETLQSGRVANEEKRQEYYSIITRESTRLTALINNILDFARIEAGRRHYSFQPTDLAEVVRETYETYRGELDRHQFSHQITVGENLPFVRADRNAVAQILVNLMSNSIKYSAEDRVLSIELKSDTRRGHRGVLLSVVDNGIGIRPEDRARIFEGFFRAADGRVLRQGGTGLGLSVVKAIVDAHGGTLEVESRLVRGTAFRIFLPASDEKREG